MYLRFVVSGKATGIVTTARVTHATPGALYAHSPSRYWENDADIPNFPIIAMVVFHAPGATETKKKEKIVLEQQ